VPDVPQVENLRYGSAATSPAYCTRTHAMVFDMITEPGSP
jgi:hypothetical protein